MTYRVLGTIARHFLSFGKAEEGARMEDRRRFTRYPIYCPIQFKCEDRAPREASVTINLSEGGALISTQKMLESPENMIIRINMKNEEFFIRSRVVHVQCGPEEGVYNVGVEFLDAPLQFRERFYEELEAMMLYQREQMNIAGRDVSLAEASVKWYHERGKNF